MTRHSKAIGTFLGTLLLAAGLTLGLGAPPALGGDVDVPSSGSFTLPDGEKARIEFRVDIDDPLVPPETTEVCNQGTVVGTNFTTSSACASAARWSRRAWSASAAAASGSVFSRRWNSPTAATGRPTC